MMVGRNVTRSDADFSVLMSKARAIFRDSMQYDGDFAKAEPGSSDHLVAVLMNI